MCSKKFTRLAALREHGRAHTGEKPFACSVCATRFTRKNDQVRHAKTLHQEKKFVCDGTLKNGNKWGCGSRFARADALKEHWSLQVGIACRKPVVDEEQSMNLFESKCHICSKTCRGIDKWKTHLQTHIDECHDPSFECACGISFAFLELKRLHLNPFVEPACGVGPSFGQDFDKKWEQWGCRQKFKSHAELGHHLLGTTAGRVCISKLRSVEQRIANMLKGQIERAMATLQLPATQESGTYFLQPNQIPLMEIDEILKKNSDRVVDLAAKEHDQALLHLLRSYQVRFGGIDERQLLLLSRAVAFGNASMS
jgi:hypothetical protein